MRGHHIIDTLSIWSNIPCDEVYPSHMHSIEDPSNKQPMEMVQKTSLGTVSRRLDDMLFTPFGAHIINYEPPRGFVVPKITMYDRTSNPFDHLTPYRQVMTLDIGNDLLLYKVFPASLHGPTLS